jgi:hypothetical protein
VVANDFALRQEKSCLTGPLPEEFTPLNLAPIHGIGVLGIDKQYKSFKLDFSKPLERCCHTSRLHLLVVKIAMPDIVARPDLSDNGPAVDQSNPPWG